MGVEKRSIAGRPSPDPTAAWAREPLRAFVDRLRAGVQSNGRAGRNGASRRAAAPRTYNESFLLRMFRDELAFRHGLARRQRRSGSGALGLLDWARLHLPEHFLLPPSLMHRWLGARLDAMDRARGSKLNVLAPRGSAKSTLATLAYVLRCAVSGAEPYIWIVSDTRQQACLHLANLKLELLDSPQLARAYPGAVGRGPVWRASAIELSNGVRIEAFGTGQRIRGRRHRAARPSLIVCDDLENDSHIESARQRERSRTWFHGALMKAGTPRTNVVNLATALHREALAVQLHATAGWSSRIFRAIRRWPGNMALWEAWEELYTNPTDPAYRAEARKFYEAHRNDMEAGAAVLWPEYEDLYLLMQMRAEGGRAAFEREKQNSPISPELCEWPEGYFNDSVWFETWPRGLRVKVIALDPSKGIDARRGDYSAFVLLGVDRQGILYVEADLARRSVPQIVADGAELSLRFQPDAFGVEANQFQDLVGAELEAELRRRGVLGARPVPLDNQVNKLVRIRRLGPLLAARRLRFKAGSPSTRLLVGQLRDFPVGDHDDGPDALEMGVRLAADLLRPAPGDGLGERVTG